MAAVRQKEVELRLIVINVTKCKTTDLISLLLLIFLQIGVNGQPENIVHHISPLTPSFIISQRAHQGILVPW